MVGRILRQPEMLLEAAEAFYDAPENRKIVAWASDVLAATLYHIIYETVEGLPPGAVRVLCGSQYEDLAALLPRRSLGSSYAATEILEIKQIIMKSAVKFNPRCGKRIPWPVPPTGLTASAEALPLGPAPEPERAPEPEPGSAPESASASESALESAPELESAPASTSTDAPESPDLEPWGSLPRDVQLPEPDLIGASTPTLVSATQATPAPTQPPESAVAQQAAPISSSEVEPEEPRAPNEPGPVDVLPLTAPTSSYGYAAGTRRVFETPTSAPSQSGTPGQGAGELPPQGTQPSEPAPIPTVLLSGQQICVRIISGGTTNALTFEMQPKMEWAKNELAKALATEWNRAVNNWKEIGRAALEGREPLLPHGPNTYVFRISGRHITNLAYVQRHYFAPEDFLEAIELGVVDGDAEGVAQLWPARVADVPVVEERAESPTPSPIENSETVLPPSTPDAASTSDAEANEGSPSAEQPSPDSQTEGEPEDAHQKVPVEDDGHANAGETEKQAPVELPTNASAAYKIAVTYRRMRIEAPALLQLRGDQRRDAVYARIAPNFACGVSTWWRAMRKVAELDQQGEPE
jgi:hypothetical protein